MRRGRISDAEGEAGQERKVREDGEAREAVRAPAADREEAREEGDVSKFKRPPKMPPPGHSVLDPKPATKGGYNRSGTPKLLTKALRAPGKPSSQGKVSLKQAPGSRPKLISEGGTAKLKPPRGSSRQHRDRKGRFA
jgi:hypothetical protein